ncbi:MAG: hypothetical protein LBK52_00680 [Deltaproteobacteria bacterium]|jgi:hypothetical protein|nr:hypothetical protein [Deltaproteobacteria bacterium]
MKNFLLPVSAAFFLFFLAAACGPPRIYKQPVFPVCEGRTRVAEGPISSQYIPLAASNCRQYMLSKDVSAWVEAPLNSHRQRGLNTMVLGCANLTARAETCEYGGPLGHASTMETVFDFTRYPDTARVRRAVLAVYAFDNMSFLTQNVQLRGRLTAGDPYQSLAAQRQAPPGGLPGYIIFDITDIAARAIDDRRTSVNFELALPCGRNDRELSTVGILQREPLVLVEYQ